MTARTDLLTPLDHIAYLLECSAISCNGELKSELTTLCDAIRNGHAEYGAGLVLDALPQLERALSAYRNDQYAEGASIISAVSQQWWLAAGGARSDQQSISAECGLPDEPIRASATMDKRRFIARFEIPCFYHFTDRRNLPGIRSAGAVLSLNGLQERGIVPPAPGGNQWSHDADILFGLDDYVCLCLMDWHPMEYAARQQQRVAQTTFLRIKPSVIMSDDVRFAPGVSNKSGVPILTFEQAIESMDFAAVYDDLDRKDPEIKARRVAASKYEILIPNAVPVSLIEGL